MAKWCELKYYAHGTPTKTAMRYRRLHLFTHSFMRESSPCGLSVSPIRLSEGLTDVQKCKHCLKHVGE